MTTTTATESLFVKMAVSAWESQVKSFSELVDSLTDEQLAKEISPGRNTGVYLLGHLVAVSDGMLPLLGFGDKMYPELEEIFLRNPDKSGLEKPPLSKLRECLRQVNAKLADGMAHTSPGEWFDRHMAISPENFSNEPHRNRLNVLINRTNHLANHLGQLLLLK
jgi:DinB superfamily